MLDIKFIRENPEVVKENIKKKFQEQKLPLVDEVIALDSENRAVMAEAQELRSSRNTLSMLVGMLMTMLDQIAVFIFDQMHSNYSFPP